MAEGAADSTDVGAADTTDVGAADATVEPGVREAAGTDGDARGLTTDGPPHAAKITAAAIAPRRGIFLGSMSRKAS